MTEENNNNKEIQINQASPEMQIFFRKLLNLKIYVEAAKDLSGQDIFSKIYEKLDEIIKEGK